MNCLVFVGLVSLALSCCLQQVSAGLGHRVPAMRDLRRKASASTRRAERENPKTLNKLDAKSKPKQNEAGEEGDKQIALFTLTYILYLAANDSSKLVSAQSTKNPICPFPKHLTCW